ncbi:MAG: VTT domain-containing protein [Anaerolineaceae bacterium]
MSKDTQKKVLRWLAISFVVALTIVLFVNRDAISKLEIYGYPGIFIISLLTNASLILPIPGVLFTSAMGTVFNPIWVAVAAGSGAALGEISGYLAGFSGQPVVENLKGHQQIEGWMRRYGNLTIFVLAFVPNPAFDVAGIIAGAMKIPLRRFLFWCWLGKILKMAVFAYGGYWILNLFPWAQ